MSAPTQLVNLAGNGEGGEQLEQPAGAAQQPANVGGAAQRPAGASFNFQNFLEKMRQPGAVDLVKSVKTFITDQNNKHLVVSEYEKLIQSFLNETSEQLASHKLWENASDEELDNAAEGLEKYLMNKMYKVCFQPASSDDLQRDQALLDKFKMFSFLQPKHFDVPNSLCEGDEFNHAKEELCKMDTYKAPRDKMICVLNCCKIINKMLQSSTDKAVGADEFFPLLVYITLAAQPPKLWSNLQFIGRFRNPVKLQGEPGYYFTTLSGVVEFTQTMGPKELSIEAEEFDRELTKALEAQSTPPLPDPAADAQPGIGDLADFLGSAALGSSAAAAQPAASSAFGHDLLGVGQPQPAAGPGQGAWDLLGAPPTSAPAPTTLPGPAGASGSLIDLASPAVTGGGAAQLPGVSTASALGSIPVGGGASQPSSPGGNMMQQHLEMMRALSEPPIAKLVNCTVEELSMMDIPMLLADYKRLASLNDQLRTFLYQQGLGAPTSDI